jgi:hemin uptake protein HemP
LLKVQQGRFLAEKAMVDPRSSRGDEVSAAGEKPLPAGGGEPCHLCGIEVDAAGTRRTTSAALLGTRTELQIVHRGEIYRLTLTRFGKLMLQK